MKTTNLFQRLVKMNVKQVRVSLLNKSYIEKSATCGHRQQIFPVHRWLSKAVSVRNACFKWMVTSRTQEVWFSYLFVAKGPKALTTNPNLNKTSRQRDNIQTIKKYFYFANHLTKIQGLFISIIWYLLWNQQSKIKINF